MKVRMCFVSNSSSCSSIVYIPTGFEPEWEKYESFIDDDETDIDKCKEAFKKFMYQGNIWQEQSYNEYEVLERIFEAEGMIIAQIDTGPDAGQIAIADKSKILKNIAREKGK